MKKKIIVAAGLMVMALAMAACGQSGSGADAAEKAEGQQETGTADSTEASSEATIEYDDLQSMFIGITTETSKEDIQAAIDKSGLPYTSEEYNGDPKEVTYQIAYTEGAAKQKYGDTGDYVSVSFSQEDGSLLTAEYCKASTFKSAVLYNYGVYWDFNFEKDNDYAGYYWNKSGDGKGGVTLKYSNGNEAETGYHKVADAAEAVREAISED